MNLLHLSSGRGFGGGERHVLDLAVALADRGHRVHIALRRDSALQKRLAAFPRIRCHVLGLCNAVDPTTIIGLRRIIRTERIDVVHAHYGRDYTLAAAAVRWTRRGGIPAFFFTRHHYLPLSSNPLYRAWLSVADGAIAVSRSVRDTLCASLGWPPDRVRVIPNWVDAAAFRPTVSRTEARTAFNLPPSGRLVGVINQLAETKGQMDMVAAFVALARDFPDLGLVLAGAEATGTTFTDRLRHAIKLANVTDRVFFPGFVTNVPTLLAALDAVAIPSWDEAFSLGALEAMAAGVPVVACGVGGLAEIVIPDSTGLTVPPRDPGALAAALRRLLTDDDLYRNLVAAGRETTGTRYTLENAVTQVEQMYTAGLPDNPGSQLERK